MPTILRFLWNNKKNCSILCKYSVCFYFLFFWLLLPKICFPCTYCTNSALYPRSWLWMSLLWTSKGLFVLYVATVNWIIWHFSLMIVILIWSLNLIFNKKAFLFVFRFVMCVSWVLSRSCLTSTPAYTFQDVPELGKSRGSLFLVAGGGGHCAVVCHASGGADRNSSHQHVFSAWAWRMMGCLCHSPAKPLNPGLDEPRCVDLWDKNGTQQQTTPFWL